VRLYVAGPMTGIPQNNYPEFFNVERYLRDRGYDILNPARIDQLYNQSLAPRPWNWYMRKAIHMLVSCDGVATLPGWRQSRGASLEVDVARRLEMGVRPYLEWPEVGVNA
jgi:hypothetical protein